MNEEHGGIIRVSRPLLDQLMGDALKISDVDTQGTLRDRGVYDEVRKKLLLPDTYVIHGIYYHWLRRSWELVVEGPDLPLAHEGVDLPVIVPIYISEANGVVALVRIETERDHFGIRVGTYIGPVMGEGDERN